MTKLNFIPEPEFEQHDADGTLGDSDSMDEKDLEFIDSQLKSFGLEIVSFENGSAINWFIQKIP